MKGDDDMKKYLFIFSLIVSFFFITKVNASGTDTKSVYNSLDFFIKYYNVNYPVSINQVGYTFDTPGWYDVTINGELYSNLYYSLKGNVDYQISYEVPMIYDTSDDLVVGYNVYFAVPASHDNGKLSFSCLSDEGSSDLYVGNCSIIRLGTYDFGYSNSQGDMVPDVILYRVHYETERSYLFYFTIRSSKAFQLYPGRLDYSVLYKSSSIDSVRDEIISNQNSNSQAEIEQAQKNHDDMMNADADSALKDKDTSAVDDYNKAEDDLIGQLDVDTSDVTFDVGSYKDVFSWIWNTITSFLQSNGKVFMAVTSTLILSFVGLVIGRG